jgi:hypothetical protein
MTFLNDRPDSNHPSTVWSPAEQRRYRNPVLGRDYIFQGFPGAFQTITVLAIAPVVPGVDSVYVVKTLIGDVYQPDHEVKVLGVLRVYAQREGNHWVLSNGIDRLTVHWVRQRIGGITFVYPPGIPSTAVARRGRHGSPTRSPPRSRCRRRGSRITWRKPRRRCSGCRAWSSCRSRVGRAPVRWTG